MTHTLSLNDVKAIVKTVTKHDTRMNLRISSESIFVQRAEDMEQGKNRYHFLVSKGGNGKILWFAGMALNWLSNAATGAAGMGTSGVGALASGGTTAVGKAASMHSLGGAFRAGVMRDAQAIHQKAGVKNMLVMLETHNALSACGCVDAIGENEWAMFVTTPSSVGYYDKYKRILYGQDLSLRHPYKGTYLPGHDQLTLDGAGPLKLQKA